MRFSDLGSYQALLLQALLMPSSARGFAPTKELGKQSILTRSAS